jgi:ubiquinone/menaquinone biosynthesis C-methylase UbiE
MSDFSAVDASLDPTPLVRYLEATDAGLAAIKSYMAAAAARAVPPGGTVLDLGCGIGLDIGRLEAAGLTAIGIDPSAVMLGGARSRTQAATRLARADGARLPFRTGALDGCRIERVLQHVDDPATVVAEVRRVVRPGGFLAVFEPDHTSFQVDSEAGDDFLWRAMRARHKAIGAELPALLEAQGFVIDDVVTESSRGFSFEHLPVDAEAIVRRAIVDGRVDDAAAWSWLAEQRARTADGTFRARWVKVLVVAHAG